jgi:protein LSM14
MENGLNESKVRIITKNDIRYEGTLYQINSQEKTIALKDVVSFGTEDRVTEKFIPPSDFIYEIIVFRSCEIKNLIVLKNKPEEQISEPSPQLDTPPQQTVTHQQETPIEEKKITPDKTNIPSKDNKSKTNDDFLFSDMLHKFKEIENKKISNQISNYKKDDFFDTLTSSIDNKNSEKNSLYHSHKTTKETFGNVGQQNSSNYQKRNYNNRPNNYQQNKGYQNYSHNSRFNKNKGGYFDEQQKDNYQGHFQKQRKDRDFEYVKKTD